MSLTLIAVLVLIVLAIIAGLAFAVYKAGFRTTKVKVKTGLLEAEMERTPAQAADGTPQTPSAELAAPAQFRQEAIRRSKIRKSSIEAPAGAPASASQKAEDDSSLEDSHIKLT
jgi:Tfp pilus assembly protein PilE